MDGGSSYLVGHVFTLSTHKSCSSFSMSLHQLLLIAETCIIVLYYIIYSYGECSVYKSETVVCDGVLIFGITNVYATSVLGDQSTIAALLNQHIRNMETVLSDLDEECVKQVFRVLCHFYLPPCGNTTHPVPPSSICQEECQMVQDKCWATWESVLLTVSDLDLIINCNDTSTLLFPVPHCCTGAGLGLLLYYIANPLISSECDSVFLFHLILCFYQAHLQEQQ